MLYLKVCWGVLMALIREVVQQALVTGLLTIEAEDQLRQLLLAKYDTEDFRAFMTLQSAAMSGSVKQESRHLVSSARWANRSIFCTVRYKSVKTALSVAIWETERISILFLCCRILTTAVCKLCQLPFRLLRFLVSFLLTQRSTVEKPALSRLAASRSEAVIRSRCSRWSTKTPWILRDR